MYNKKQKSEANAAKETAAGEEGQKSKADLRRERRAIQVFTFFFAFWVKCSIGALSLNL